MPQIKIIDKLDRPLFLATRWKETSQALVYYRVYLPARMSGGVVRHEIEVSCDGGRFEPFYPYGAESVQRVMRSTASVFRGLGCPTILEGRNLCAVPGALDLVRIVNGAVPDSLWLDWDDHLSAEEYGSLVAKMSGVDSREAATVAEAFNHELYNSTQRHIVATEPLRTAVLQHNPTAVVSVGPNAIAADEFPRRQQPRKPGPVRVGYAATMLHMQDLPLVLPGLVAAARAGAELSFFGVHPGFCQHGFRAGRYGFEGTEYFYGGMIETFDEFHQRIADLDVAVAPLTDCEHNRCKSPQKWYEHALHSTPMVVSDLEPYRVVEHDITGFKARTAADFTKYLLMLCSDADMRRRIGQAARETVIQRHSTAALADQWRAAVGVLN